MGKYISMKEAGLKLKVKPRTIRAWIRELKETDPEAYGTHTLTHPHPYNPMQAEYEINEDFLKELQERRRTHLRTHLRTHFEGVSEPSPEAVKGDTESTPGNTVSPDLLTQMFNTLTRELEAQRETLNRVLQDHAKEREKHAEERERADILILRLREDIRGLNEKVFLLTEGKKEEPGNEGPGTVDKPPDTPEDIRFTFSDRLWLWKEDVKRFLNRNSGGDKH